MDSIKIQDVRELCQRGAMRAYAKNGGVYLEDTTSKESVRLDNRHVAGHTDPGHTGKNGSRLERMFGKRESWPSRNVDEGQGPYKGFLMIECEECGEVKAFCAKRETYSFKCNCGHITPLENLRPMFMHCKCGEDFRYKTNIGQGCRDHGDNAPEAGRERRGIEGKSYRIIKGGTGYCIHLENGKEVFDKANHHDLPQEVERMFPDYSLYPQYDFAVSMTSRGCPRGCGFCHVAAKEGRCSYKVAEMRTRQKATRTSREKTPSRTAQMPERRFYCARQEANL